jgi:hypothetical protein
VAPLENSRFDSYLEFDSLNDRLARFLLDEVIPHVESHRTSDGILIKLSTNPEFRSGFRPTQMIGRLQATAQVASSQLYSAWEGPDAFNRSAWNFTSFPSEIDAAISDLS